MATTKSPTALGATAVNQPPNIISSSIARAVMEGDTYFDDIAAVDPDGDPLTWFISGGADARFFQIDKYGSLSFKSARDYNAPKDADHDNRYDVIVGVKDRAGATDYVDISAYIVPEAAIKGTNGYNHLVGTDGNDTIDGKGGGDEIYGGAGNDYIIGGNGADSLWGGAGRDTFVYKAVSESSVGSGGDTIFDFNPLQDLIDLEMIDADASKGGNQAFTLLPKDAEFTGRGQIAWYHETINGQVHTILEMNTSGGLAPEMVIDLVGAYTNLDHAFIL